VDTVTRPEPRDCRATSWRLITARTIKVELVHIPTGATAVAEDADEHTAVRSAWRGLLVEMGCAA
jgi:hypothetical protein